MNAKLNKFCYYWLNLIAFVFFVITFYYISKYFFPNIWETEILQILNGLTISCISVFFANMFVISDDEHLVIFNHEKFDLQLVSEQIILKNPFKKVNRLDVYKKCSVFFIRDEDVNGVIKKIKISVVYEWNFEKIKKSNLSEFVSVFYNHRDCIKMTIYSYLDDLFFTRISHQNFCDNLKLYENETMEYLNQRFKFLIVKKVTFKMRLA